MNTNQIISILNNALEYLKHNMGQRYSINHDDAESIQIVKLLMSNGMVNAKANNEEWGILEVNASGVAFIDLAANNEVLKEAEEIITRANTEVNLTSLLIALPIAQQVLLAKSSVESLKK